MSVRSHRSILLLFALALLQCQVAVSEAAHEAVVNGVKVGLHEYQGPAGIVVTAIERFRLRIQVQPDGERGPLVVRVDLPKTGPAVWPDEAVQVVDAKRQPVLVRHNGIAWNQFSFSVPPVHDSYYVQVIDESGSGPSQRPPSEAERTAIDPKSRLAATICAWFDGRRAALSIRFDDSHPTHLSKAIPMLREQGLKGTFMINPGTAGYVENRAAWEAVARRADQEFANHTLHHRGAGNDEEMEREIGEASEYIWSIFPQSSKLLALNLGGGTVWETRRPLRYYLEKYHLFPVSGSLGMDDVYGDRVSALRRHIQRHIERGLWCRVHFHSIGAGLSTSDENFRAAMEVVREHRPELWIAGMADIHKYQTERKAARLSLKPLSANRLALRLSCATNPSLFDQPLTIELTFPTTGAPEKVTLRDEASRALTLRHASHAERAVVRFDIPPVDASYVIETTP